jgi:hypothetical protein
MPTLNKQRQYVEISTLCLILALAAYLRLANVADNPGWYADEGAHLEIARNLLQGRVQYLAITQSTLLVARLPLFDVLLAGLLGALGSGIATLRAFTGALGTATVGLLYLVVRRAQPGRPDSLASLSALMLAIYPQAVVYSRFGFSYNLLALLVLLAILGCWEYLASTRRRWLVLAALTIGLGCVSDLWMFTLIAPLTLLVLARNWRDMFWSLPLAGLPFGLYAAVMLARCPQAFLFDLNFTLLRLSKLSPIDQVNTLATNYATLLLQDAWIALGVVGLFLLRPARLRRLSLLLFLLPILILGRTTALYNLGFYYTIPLLPLVGLGLGSLLRHGIPHVWRTIHIGNDIAAIFQSRSSRLGNPASVWVKGSTIVVIVLLSLIVATPFVTSLAFTVGHVHDGFSTQIDPFLIDPTHARQTAAFLNSHTDQGDLVIAWPSLAWMLDANTADVQLAATAAGCPTPDLPAGIPQDRFAFDVDWTRARFVVVDKLWHNWAVWNVPCTRDWLGQVETWPLAFEAGEVKVYCNPARCSE